MAGGLEKAHGDFREDWPRVSKVLVKKLRETFPDRCIGETQALEEAHRYAGKVEMVRFLELVEESQRGN